MAYEFLNRKRNIFYIMFWKKDKYVKTSFLSFEGSIKHAMMFRDGEISSKENVKENAQIMKKRYSDLINSLIPCTKEKFIKKISKL